MILVIDNYDSFTYNLVHYLNELGAQTHVYRNDALTVEEALGLRPEAVLLSPGPCTPNEAGICLAILQQAPETLPILGVCLGPSGHRPGGRRQGDPRQGPDARQDRRSTTAARACSPACPAPSPPRAITAWRWSAKPCPASLEITAWSEDGEIMGLQHRDRPVHGVQFHPESIATEHGHELLANFLNLAGVKRLRPYGLIRRRCPTPSSPYWPAWPTARP